MWPASQKELSTPELRGRPSLVLLLGNIKKENKNLMITLTNLFLVRSDICRLLILLTIIHINGD